jgi:hypothetical protein
MFGRGGEAFGVVEGKTGYDASLVGKSHVLISEFWTLIE